MNKYSFFILMILIASCRAIQRTYPVDVAYETAKLDYYITNISACILLIFLFIFIAIIFYKFKSKS